MVMTPPIQVQELRLHLREHYHLDEDQVTQLLGTARKSLSAYFEDLDDPVFAETADLKDHQSQLLHTLKGVLLHLGLRGWAGWASGLHRRLERGEFIDLKAESAGLRAAVGSLLEEHEWRAS
jgi:hypothetical protein